MPSFVYIVFFAVLVEQGFAGVTPMAKMIGLSADIARLNCNGFPSDLLPSDRQLTAADLESARDAALAMLATRVGMPQLPLANDTLPTDIVESANRGLCDVNILIWLLPWPVCRVQSPPPRPAPVDAVREEVQRCY